MSMKCLVQNVRVFAVGTACLMATGLWTQSASAAVIYSDTFSRTTGSGDANGNPTGAGNGSSSWGAADNGLGGSLAVSWNAGRTGSPAPTGGAQFVINGARAYLYSGAAHTTSSVAGLAPNGFSVAFDFSRIDTAIVATASNGFVSVGTGYNESVNQFSPFEVSGNSSFAVLFQQAAQGNPANMQVFAAGALQGNFNYVDPAAAHSVLLEFAPAVAGNYLGSVDYQVTVDGNLLNSGTVAGGAEFGDLAFATNLFTASYIDNLVVTATAPPVPEPAGILLAGLSGLAMLRRRRS
ncbi:hypothetical protein Pla175_21790 [Pirellulimonas nuda]|uniref:PEP-CTERM protein-sorting domain-containing protein n=1 Tax=Pirellulimonas nuda TaxID=2528009 RepID=A0A518DBD4_9BACT|nr:PEP-CTERM sorting domain-containing protein [Pirellulimonas nuda]QDU88795.1 hypothetical protein Pla175_21790 [Pirellulimonas nuda]